MADKDQLEAIADELEVIASWHTGPKYNRVMALATAVRGLDSGQTTVEDLTAYSTATTAPPAPEPEAEPEG